MGIYMHKGCVQERHINCGGKIFCSFLRIRTQFLWKWNSNPFNHCTKAALKYNIWYTTWSHRPPMTASTLILETYKRRDAGRRGEYITAIWALQATNRPAENHRTYYLPFVWFDVGDDPKSTLKELFRIGKNVYTGGSRREGGPIAFPKGIPIPEEQQSNNLLFYGPFHKRKKERSAFCIIQRNWVSMARTEKRECGRQRDRRTGSATGPPLCPRTFVSAYSTDGVLSSRIPTVTAASVFPSGRSFPATAAGHGVRWRSRRALNYPFNSAAYFGHFSRAREATTTTPPRVKSTHFQRESSCADLSRPFNIIIIIIWKTFQTFINNFFISKFFLLLPWPSSRH